ncbi:GrpB family protein [Paenibacillus sp. RC67]|uniref:GrpB family protein n=1 Tax=Paenibacillus sp. RC67 TaxID=3039392 RepID=UPI0024ADB31A|nr:GrpB family protein [Paenibacillus sp. RC67]
MLGVPGGKVFLVPWTEDWEKEFLTEKKEIESRIGHLIYGIHHIGSTAIKNISAKPIIDIAIEMEYENNTTATIQAFEALGYVHKSNTALPGRYYLTKGSPRTHQIHLYYSKGSRFLQEHLAFRDYLRTHDRDRNRYEQLKVELAGIYSNDRIAYAEAKSDFVKEILRKSGLLRS